MSPPPRRRLVLFPGPGHAIRTGAVCIEWRWRWWGLGRYVHGFRVGPLRWLNGTSDYGECTDSTAILLWRPSLG